MNQNVIYKEGIISEIVLNRPEKLNSLNKETLNELKQALNAISENQSCKCAIIRGAGSRAFSAGADLEYLSSLKDKNEAGEFFDLMYSTFHQIELIEKPFIAAIHGYCLGGGNELAIACDIRIASYGSVFGQPETTLGIVPGGGAQHKLPMIIGKEKAKELISTGKTFNAEEALKIGLIGLLVNNQELDSEATRLASGIIEMGYAAAVERKKSITRSISFDYEKEKKEFVEHLMSEKGKNGIDAFLRHKKQENKEK